MKYLLPRSKTERRTRQGMMQGLLQGLLLIRLLRKGDVNRLLRGPRSPQRGTELLLLGIHHMRRTTVYRSPRVNVCRPGLASRWPRRYPARLSGSQRNRRVVRNGLATASKKKKQPEISQIRPPRFRSIIS